MRPRAPNWLVIRLLGAIVGVGFIIGTFNDLRSGQYDSHGLIILRSIEPLKFWIGTTVDAFTALSAFALAFFGSVGPRKS